MSRPGKKRKFFIWIVVSVLIVMALSACAAATPQPQASPAGYGAAESQEIPRVTLQESKAAFDSSSAVFLDVRSESAYAASHIPGALSIPLGELETRTDELGSDRWIITYCT